MKRMGMQKSEGMPDVLFLATLSRYFLSALSAGLRV